MFCDEFIVFCDGVAGNAKHCGPCIGKGLQMFGKSDGLLGATRRIIAGIEKQNNDLTLQVRKGNFTAAVAWQGERGGKVRGFEHVLGLLKGSRKKSCSCEPYIDHVGRRKTTDRLIAAG